ncbi:hypothetical protein ACHAP5_007184 [Fusarium lateritium]
MTAVYENAYLTVVDCKGSNSSDGLFCQMSRREYFEFEYISGEARGSLLTFSISSGAERHPGEYVTLPNEPLSQRGWALQERVLSRRTLLYTSDQICFHCSKGLQGEDGLLLGRRFAGVYEKPKANIKSPEEYKNGSNRKDNTPSGQQAILEAWNRLVSFYGMRKLTNASDKLSAISGLAKIYAEQLQDEYVAGFWRSHLVKDLMCGGKAYRRVQEYRAPSWSWAPIDGMPGGFSTEDKNEIAEILGVKVTLKGTNPYGEVTDGRIQFQAPIEPLYLVETNKLGLPYRAKPQVRSKYGGAIAWFDFNDWGADGR